MTCGYLHEEDSNGGRARWEHVVRKGLSEVGTFKLSSEGKGSSHATPSGKSVLSRGNRKYGGPELEGAWPVLGMVKEPQGLQHREGGGVIQKQVEGSGRGGLWCVMCNTTRKSVDFKCNEVPWTSFKQKSIITSFIIIKTIHSHSTDVELYKLQSTFTHLPPISSRNPVNSASVSPFNRCRN